MANPPIPFDEERRQRVLDESGVLDLSDDTFADLTSSAAERWGVPIATVSLIDRGRQCFKGAVGLEADGTDRDVAFCAYTIMHEQPFVIPDARNDQRFADNPLVTGDLGIRFYAGAPVTLDGAVIGSFCLIDTKPRSGFSATDQEKLQAYAQIASRLIEKVRLDELTSLTIDQQLQLSDERRRLADRERAVFLAVVSHELRTPLNAIGGFAEVLRNADPAIIQPAEQTEYLQLICEGTKQLHSITESALKFAAADFGRLPMTVTTFALADAARSGLRLLALSADLADLEGWKVTADEDHLRQVFMSVTAALIEKGANGVALSAAEDPDGSLRITFDPMPPEAGVQLGDDAFEPFRYDDNVLGRGQSGLELDFALADRLARAHGCRISAETASSDGSRVVFSIPAHLIDDSLRRNQPR